MKHKTYTDQFKISMVEEFLRGPSKNQKLFAESRGFSDAALRSWINDPRYNPKAVKTPLRAKNVAKLDDYEGLYPPAQAAVLATPIRPAYEQDSRVQQLIGKLIVRLVEIDPNFTI